MRRRIDGSRSLTQLENDDWGDPPSGATNLVSWVHRLRRTPLEALDAGDLRVLIGQDIGAGILVPRALSLLRADPWLEGTYFPGDLLAAVLKLPTSFWAGHPAELAVLRQILDAAELGEGEQVDDGVLAEIASFRERVRSVF